MHAGKLLCRQPGPNDLHRVINLLFRDFSSPAHISKSTFKSGRLSTASGKTFVTPQRFEDTAWLAPAFKHFGACSGTGAYLSSSSNRGQVGASVDTVDALAEIGGNHPKTHLADGDSVDVSSKTSESVYKIKRTWDHYSCSCPAWRNQSRAIDSRTCKHLLDLLGEAHETARLKLKDPDSPLLHAPKRKSKPHRVTMPEAPQKDSADMAKTGSSIVGVDGTVPQLLLAKVWDVDDGPDPTGWWISEKLDGVRTFYDGKQLISRLGNRFSPPDAFMQQFPKDITLDGELFVGRGKFSATVSIVRTIDSPKWGDIKFHAFDIPSMETQPFEARMDELKSLFGPRGKFKSKQIKIVKQTEARSREHVIQELKAVEALGGEGLMLRKPQSLYVSKRSSTLLKIKTFFDAEAKVEDYLPGKGRLVGTVGSLVCRMESGKIFSVGSGLTDDDRRNPPSVGCIIVYRFQELSKDGIPRFPTFVGLSADKVMAKDADIPVNRIGGSKSS